MSLEWLSKSFESLFSKAGKSDDKKCEQINGLHNAQENNISIVSIFENAQCDAKI